MLPVADSTTVATGDGDVYPARFLRTKKKKYVPDTTEPDKVDVAIVGAVSVRLDA
jgi:hypothetical protein